MLKLIIFALGILLLFAKDVSSARILAIIQSPSYSHQVFYRPLWTELANRGHELVVVTGDPTDDNHPNIREVSIKESYSLMKQMMDMMVNTSITDILLENKWQDLYLNLNKVQLGLPSVQALISNKTEHFDLLIIEHFSTSLLGFKHRFKCPMIGVSSLDALSKSHEVMGNPVHSVLYPVSMFPFQEDLTFLQRIVVVVFGNMFTYFMSKSAIALTALGREYFGEDMPPVEDLLEEADMLFVNANPVFSATRPYSPSTISVAGGMHIAPPKTLPTDLKAFLDSADGGAIYFSLGSNVKSNELSLELRRTIMETFSQLPYKILWKFENEDLPGKPENVKITKWAPQQDILRHKHVKLFITQGGIQSLEESLYSHMPIVVMPFIADQEANAGKVKNKGLGIMVDRHNLKVDDFKAAIFEVMLNPTYKETVKRLAAQIQDTPRSPLENAVWWIEYVLRHKGAQHLKGPRIPLYQYYYLDVLSFLGAVLLIVLGLLFAVGKLALKGVCYLMRCSHKQNLTKKQKVKKS